MEQQATNKNLKPCKACGKEMAKSAKACPHCGAKNKKPIFLRGWFIAVVVLLVAFVVSNILIAKPNYTITATVVESGETTTYKANEIRNMVREDAQAFLDTFVNTETIIEFTATVTNQYSAADAVLNHDMLNNTYNDSWVYECDDIRVSCFTYPTVEVGDEIAVTGMFDGIRVVNNEIEYIAVVATSVEKVK